MKAKHGEAWSHRLTGALVLPSLTEFNEAVPAIVLVVVFLHLPVPVLSTPPTNA